MNIPALFTENFRLKFLSLLFAAVLGLFVALEAKDEVEIPLQVKFINIPPGLALKYTVVRNPSVRVAGPRILLIKQQLTGVVVLLDLSGTAAGKASFSSMERHLKVHDGVTLLRVSPPIIELVLVKDGKPGHSN
jgi:hypothetical protein